MKSLKKLTLAAALTACLGLLSSTSSVFADPPPPGTVLAPQQVLNYNFTTIGTLDPTLMQWSSDFSVGRMLYTTLDRTNRDGQYVGYAAQSWTTSKDGLVWTFNLRKDAIWSDGKPVTAQDFVYSWQRLANPKTGAPYAYFLPLMHLKNAQAVISGKMPVSALGIKALDKYTLQLTLSKPTPWLLTMLPLTVLAPEREDIIKKYGMEWTQPGHLVSSGPYILTKYLVNDILQLKKNPKFFNAAGTTITNINIDFIQNPDNNYFGFLTGKYLLSGIPQSFIGSAFKNHYRELISTEGQDNQWLEINTHVVKSVKARKALAMLINRKILCSQIWKWGTPTALLAPGNIEGTQYFKQPEWFSEPYSQRVKEAKELLREAGYTSAHPLNLTYLTQDPKSDHLFVALQSWFHTGSGGAVNLKIAVAQGSTFYDRVANKEYDITSSGWQADFPQVTTFLTTMTCDSGVNSNYVCLPEYDKLVNQAANESDPDKRAQLYAKAETMMVDYYGYVGLANDYTYTLKSPVLQGYNPYLPYRYFQDYYILKNPPACYENGGTTLCGTDLSGYWKYTHKTPPGPVKLIFDIK